MKLPREEARKQTLCVLSTRLCEALRFNAPILKLSDVQHFCTTVAKNCELLGCKTPASLCAKAALAKDEKEFFKTCHESVKSCSTSRKEKAKKVRKTAQFYMS